MPLLYDPGEYMPTSIIDFDQMSWMLTWNDGPWHIHDLEPGGTVYLVRAGETQRIIWETRVTHSFGVPYEAVGDLAAEVRRRWGLRIQTPKMTPGGFCIGWRAEAVDRLEREPRTLPDWIIPADDDVLDLDGFQQSEHLSAAFNHRWGLPHEPDVACTGRPRIGWFGPDR
jgi:hypothetical protein